MNRSRICLSCILLLAPAALAQVQEDEILLSYGSSSYPRLVHYRPDGTLVAQTAGGTGANWLGATILRDGRWLTTYRYPTGANIFDASGTQVMTFSTPEIPYAAGDSGVLADGTLVIVDIDGEVELYTDAGLHLRTISASGLTYAYGVFIDDQNHIWVTDLDPGITGGEIYEFHPNGTLITSFATSFEAGDLVVAGDGTIWCSDRFNCAVRHLSATGVPLGAFRTDIVATANAIGMASDGTIYCTGSSMTALYHYDPSGNLLDSFEIERGANFLTVEHPGPPGTGYCFGDPGSGTPCPCANDNDGSVIGSGCSNGVFASGALLTGTGAARVGGDHLVLTASGLEPDNACLFFQADNDLSPGTHWGDGLRCAGGNLKRLEVSQANGAGAASTTIVVSTKAGNVVAGDVKRYQCWYRTTANPPCGAGVNDFNTSNGYEVQWRP